MFATPIELAEHVARLASDLGIETALIGAYAMAAHNYVRATDDIDLASHVPLSELRRLQAAADAAGLRTKLRAPDEDDPLGGVLVIWTEADEDDDPIDPVEVVNFDNPFRLQVTPAREAIEHAISLAETPALRAPRLADLVALKLYSGGPLDERDVIELLVRNPDANLELVRTVATSHGLARIDRLIEEAARERLRRR